MNRRRFVTVIAALCAVAAIILVIITARGGSDDLTVCEARARAADRIAVAERGRGRRGARTSRRACPRDAGDRGWRGDAGHEVVRRLGLAPRGEQRHGTAPVRSVEVLGFVDGSTRAHLD